MLTFQVERWETYLPDAEALWPSHAEDIGASLPFGPDVPFYHFLDLTGQLLILTARRAGRMVGYVLVLVRPHPHYRTVLCGFEDSYWLHQSERKGRTGLQMIQKALEELKVRGVKRCFFHEKHSYPTARLWQHLGFKADSTVWFKDLS